MKIRMLFLALAMLAISAACFGAQALVSGGNTGFPMTTRCNGTTPLPDGTVLVWMQNWNNLPAPVCPDPPDCYEGVLGQWNANTATIQGDSWDPESHAYAGMWWTDGSLVSAIDVPPPPNNVYYWLLKYNVPGSSYTQREGDSMCTYHIQTIWKSATVTVASGAGGSNDFDFGSMSYWTCTEVIVKDGCVYSPSCQPTLTTTFHPLPPFMGLQSFHECVTLCAPQTHTVCVGPLPKQNRRPHGFFIHGCG